MHSYNTIHNRREKTHHYVQHLNADEEREFEQLVTIFRGMGFTQSA